MPEGSVVEGSEVGENRIDSADYVIIGSGAGGATAARTLSTGGYSVIVLEEGPWVKTRQFERDVFPSMKKMFRDAATSVALGSATIPIFQGRCVGGGTTINSAIAWRAPEYVIDSWNKEYGLQGAITFKDLERQFDSHDRALTVRAVGKDILGVHGSIFSEASLKSGIRAEIVTRYDGGCVASASCLTGCRSGKKLGMNLTYIPEALHHGARIYTSTQALRIESRHGRARAVYASFLSPKNPAVPYSLKVTARRGVIVAASAVQTPGILKRSGIRLPAVGKHFQAHLGTSLISRFDRVVSMEYGATQGFNSTHFVKADRFKIETLSLPPELVSLRLPRIGSDFMRDLFDYQHLSNWALVVRGEAEGQVRNVLGRDFVQYTPTQADVEGVRRGLKTLSEMMFTAGAKEVLPFVHGMPVLKSPDDLHLWDQASLEPGAYGMMISHLFGSARMGPDPRTSVVGLDFQVHGTRGIYVLDSSLFPTNLGVNPQHTIMAIASLGSERILERPLPVV